MKFALIAGTVMLTALVFFSAMQSISAEIDNQISSNAASQDVSRDKLKAAFAMETETLTGQLSDLEMANEGLAEQVASLTTDRDRLNQKLSEASSESEAAAPKLRELVEEKAELTAQLSDLETANEGLAEQIAGLTAERDGLTEELSEAKAAVSAQVSDVTAEQAQSNALLADAKSNIATLTDTVESERQKAEALETQLATSAAQIATLTDRIADLTSGSAQASDASDDQAAELQAQLEETTLSLAAAEERINALTTDADQQSSALAIATAEAGGAKKEIATLRAEISELTASIAERDNSLAELQAVSNAGDQPTISSCSEQTRAVFIDQKLSFDRGTATISETSVASLDALISIARDCADANLMVEIGGHTDSQGGELSNQKLSEERARAVFTFLEAGGVPTASMRPVGLGETAPIADNATSEGRAENRRITFDWQQR